MAGFSTASEGPAPAGCSPPISSRVSRRDLWSRAYGAAAMAFFTVSGLVKIWSGLAS